MDSGKWMSMAAMVAVRDKACGVGRTSGPRTIAATTRGGAHGLMPWSIQTSSISSTRNTTPAMRPAQIAALQPVFA